MEESESLLDSEKMISDGGGNFSLVLAAGIFLGEGDRLREVSEDGLSIDGDRTGDADRLASDSLSLVETLYSGRLCGGVRDSERDRLGCGGRGGR